MTAEPTQAALPAWSDYGVTLGTATVIHANARWSHTSHCHPTWRIEREGAES